ncbi:uncharacterized protein LOC142163073 [Nicotiana tabacum]|uniref:Uncharacterized protein LOC142163073 n=1 Tax=Nicotiana tabacum TaxID=4097 RepID=A0AC58RUM3_TOBAC
MGELNVFLGLQEKLSIKGTYISQKCIKELLKRFDMGAWKSLDRYSTLLLAGQTLYSVWEYMQGDNFNLIGYADTDYVGYLVDRKGTSGMAHFLESCLPRDVLIHCGSTKNWKILVYTLIVYRFNVSTPVLSTWNEKPIEISRKQKWEAVGEPGSMKTIWQVIWWIGKTHLEWLISLDHAFISWGTRKQNSVALSTAEVEYVSLWIKQQFEDFSAYIDCVPLLCVNTSVLNMAKNPVQQKKTKHIDVRHHFLKDNVEKGLICIRFCCTRVKITNIFTKALSSHTKGEETPFLGDERTLVLFESPVQLFESPVHNTVIEELVEEPDSLSAKTNQAVAEDRGF